MNPNRPVGFIHLAPLLLLTQLVRPPAGTCAPTPAAASPKRLALLVGVGKYYQLQPGPGQRPWPELHTSAEIEAYRQVLLRDYGFSASDVRVLLDTRATKAAISAAFREHLIDRAAPGDTVLFHFSGHGQRLPDDTLHPDEPDGTDESLVPYDALDQSVQEGSAKNIRDDELADWLETLAGRLRPRPDAPVDGNITVTLDACFSGSATRGPFIARGRSWDATTDGPLPSPQPPFPDEGAAGLLPRSGSINRDITLVAAARADQTAWERNGQGVFTHHWVRLLAQVARSAPPSYRVSVDQLAIDMAAEGLEQIPQIEGAADKLLFTRDRSSVSPPEPLLRVLQTSHSDLWLQAGEVQGVTAGSEYLLYGARPLTLGQSTPLGRARVDEVAPFSARLKMLDGATLPSPSGALATEVLHAYTLSPLRIILSGFSSAPELREQIAQLDIVCVAGEQDSSQPPAIDHDLLLRLNLAQRRIEMLRPTSAVHHAELPLGREIAAALRKKLVAEWRWRHFARLRHENPLAHLDIELVPLTPSTLAPLPPTAHFQLPAGSAFTLRLRNPSSRNLFAAVLALSPDGDLDVLVGKTAQGKNLVHAVTRFEPRPEQGYAWSLVGKPGERIVIKVLATEGFVDFSSIESTRDVHLPARDPATGLAASDSTYEPLRILLDKLGTGARGSIPLPSPLQWGTTEASVTILPR